MIRNGVRYWFKRPREDRLFSCGERFAIFLRRTEDQGIQISSALRSVINAWPGWCVIIHTMPLSRATC